MRLNISDDDREALHYYDVRKSAFDRLARAILAIMAHLEAEPPYSDVTGGPTEQPKGMIVESIMAERDAALAEVERLKAESKKLVDIIIHSWES